MSYTAGADNLVKVWDFQSGERKKNIEGFNKEVTAVSFVGISDQIAVASGDAQLKLVKDSGDSVRSFSNATDFIYSAAATPDGQWIIAGGQVQVRGLLLKHQVEERVDFCHKILMFQPSIS